jgi:lysophospholipase L1-like esterase
VTGGANSAGGANPTGGAKPTGGANPTGGVPATGGINAAGGTVSPTGGATTTNGGTHATGGSVAAPTGGKTAAGGASPTGGKAGATGGVAPTGGNGTTTTGGSGGGNTTGIPAGYPAPTTANRALCQTVAVSTEACVGQAATDVCIECLFGGSTYGTSETTPTADGTAEAGNYLVTVDLGGTAAGQTYVSAESSRGLLAAVTTTAGQTSPYAFVVNVRAMEGQPNHAGGPSGYPGLDLFFSGPASNPPQVSAIGYTLATTATKPVMVYIASDSTTCDQTGGAYGGWGQMLPEYFAPPVGIANYANSGASSSSFYGSSVLWGAIKAHWTAGDWVIVQFGHNDKNTEDSVVQANLTKYVNDAKAAGVNALLVSPPARVTSIPIGDQTGTSGLHAAAAQAAATAGGVPFIDLTALSTTWYNGLGMTKDQVVAMYHADGTDTTHTNLLGAEKLAGLVTNAIKTQKIGLAQYLR